MIWDTNTHNIYTADKRRVLTDSKYPSFGYEYEKPKTSPVTIGSDNWIGKNVSLLKGTKIANRCIIGYSTVLSNIKLEDNKTIVTSYNYKILDNKI